MSFLRNPGWIGGLAGGGTSRPPVIPPPLTNIAAWWKADAITAVSDGTAIASWPDSSGNGNDISTGNQPQRPSYFGTAGPNSYPAVQFQGNQFLGTAGNPLASKTAIEMFAVLKADLDPESDTTKTGLWNFGASSDQSHYPWTDGIIYDNFCTSARKTTVNPTPSLAAWRLYNVWSAANDWASNLDGTNIFSTVSNTVANTGACRLGWSSGIYFFSGFIAEFLLYGAKVSASDRTLIKQYIAAKYGLTIA